MICAIYARSGSVMQISPYEGSIKDQIVLINNWTKEKGLTIGRRYLDPGRSGCDNGRPGLSRMMADAALGKFHTLIVRDLSRLSRNCHDASRLIEELNLMGIRLIGIQNGFDTAGVYQTMNVIRLTLSKEKYDGKGRKLRMLLK